MHTKFVLASLIAGTTAAGGCGHAAGTHPNDMSSEGHVAAAAAADEDAAEHAAQYDPDQNTPAICDPGIEVCWDDVVNPTEGHLQRAKEHREAAAQHRAASEALRTAEATACAGLPERDRDMSPLARGAAISNVSELRAKAAKPGVKTPTAQAAGATITLRAVPGLSSAWLQRLVDCHLARAASTGFEMPEMPYCPMMVKGATAEVRTVGSEFAIDIRSDDPKTATEIWHRARALKAAH